MPPKAANEGILNLSEDLVMCTRCACQYDVPESVGLDACRLCEVRIASSTSRITFIATAEHTMAALDDCIDRGDRGDYTSWSHPGEISISQRENVSSDRSS